jgi:hypothetical protein
VFLLNLYSIEHYVFIIITLYYMNHDSTLFWHSFLTKRSFNHLWFCRGLTLLRKSGYMQFTVYPHEWRPKDGVIFLDLQYLDMYRHQLR